jgi:zinc protease
MGALSKTAEKLLLLCLGCLFVIGCRSDGQTIVPEVDAVEVPFEARPYAYQHDVLDNGMQVITLEDRSTPIAAVQVWYHVGSKDERPDRRGFAHMFEHMMFRGTQNIGPKAHFEYIRRVGGDANAYTSFDNTTYIQVVPSNQVEMVLWLEAERMGFLKINEGYFDIERRVVAEEYRMGREQPYGTVLDRLLGRIFEQHPYRWSPIGDMEELAAADATELQTFWNTYYVPNNAALVVVGDVDHAEVLAMAEQAFGWIPRYPDPPRVTVREPEQTELMKVTLKERNGPVPVVGIAYRTVPMGHRDAVALEMLGTILGGGESSRLYRDLVTDRDLAMFALSGSLGLEHDGLFAAGAVLRPFGSKPKATMAAIRDQIARIIDEGVTDEELVKARNGMLRDEVTSQLTVESKAQRLGEAALLLGDVAQVNRRLTDIPSVTREDLQRVAREYLQPQRAIEITIEPSLLGFIMEQFKDKPGKEDDDRSGDAEEIQGEGSGKPGLVRPEHLGLAPKLAPPLAAKFQFEATEHVLDNGLKVVVLPNDEVPFVACRLGLEYGAYADPDGRPGTAYMALPMLLRGSTERDYAALTDALDHHAISMSGSADMDSASVWASAVTPQAERMMRLMAEVVRKPAFSADELKKLVDQMTTGLAVTERSPGYVADRELRRHVFEGHPYARLPEGDAAALRKVEASDVSTWWSNHARPDAAVLYVAGDVDVAQALGWAEQYFGPWAASGTRPAVEVPAPKSPAPTKIYLVDREGHQSQIRVGHVGITRKNGQYEGARVLSEIFGGGFNSRLNDTIRVKKGLTYGAGGGFAADRFAGRFTISTFSKNATVVETVRTILDEVRRMKSEPPTQSEQADAISYLVGSFPRGRETPMALAQELWKLHVEGLPRDYHEGYLRSLNAVTSEDVTSVANDLIDEEHLVIVVVGPAKVLEAGLREIAPVEIVKPSAAPTEDVKD